MSWGFPGTKIFMTEPKPAGMNKLHAALMLTGIILLLIFAGCSSPSPQAQKNPVNATPAPSQNVPCMEKACFIAAANDCKDLNVTIREDIGTFRYSSSPDCIFKKTLVSMNGTESREIRNLLEGKNMTCIYTKGKFDQRLVTTLIGGIEYCRGDLKDNLARLVIFS
jgi:hypothetical protein